VLAGSDEAFNDPAEALAFVRAVGMQYPVLLKAVYGGGGSWHCAFPLSPGPVHERMHAHNADAWSSHTILP
jgi:pyruvate carboxylase